jgi:hypothetical protein
LSKIIGNSSENREGNTGNSRNNRHQKYPTKNVPQMNLSGATMKDLLWQQQVSRGDISRGDISRGDTAAKELPTCR